MVEIKKILEEATETIDKTKKTIRVVSIFRFFSFILFLVETYRGFLCNNYIELTIGIVALLLFFFFVIVSSNLVSIKQFNEDLKRICSEIINQNPNKSQGRSVEVDPEHSYAYDLDIFGKKSLFEKINRCQTNFGSSKLQFFLLNQLLDSKAIIDRQEAIKELSSKVKWNINFLATAAFKDVGTLDEKNIFAWNLNGNSLENPSVKLPLLLIPIFNLVCIALFCFLQITIFSSVLLVIPILLRLFMNRIHGKSISEIYKVVNIKSKELKKYFFIFQTIEHEDFASKEIISIKNKLVSSNKISASDSIKKLSRLIDGFENRNLPVIGGILNIVLLWDLQFAFRIEKYILENKDEISRWFEAVGEFEALICFGLFAYQNEEFVYPVCSETSGEIKAEGLSHPLLSRHNRIANDFALVQNTNVTIITGANMTGKSTFLRSIGVNMILAMNGCPVCSESFVFYPIAVFTSMRTSDSLADGSSYFNAEIKRLKKVVEKLEEGEPQLIILDEILKGTNSEDKLKGSELFLEKLINHKTLINCVIATHDIDLTKMENKYPKSIHNKCFELYNNNGALEPDYKLLSGKTKSMNAINLLREYNIID